MLLAALTMVCGNMFAQEEATTVTWEASSGDALTTIYPDGNISLEWIEGGGDQAARYSNGSVYFYNGNRLKIAGRSNDVTITKVVFTFTGDRYTMVTCDAKGTNESSTGITNNRTELTSTWEGESNSLIFRAPRQTNVRFINSIAVTYTGGTTGPVETAPVLNITSTTLGDSYDMDANGVFVVYAKNEGDAAAQNAKVTVNVDGAENTAWEIGTLGIGEQKWQNMKFDVTNIEAGEHTVTMALTADNADAFTTEKTVTFTKKAAEATYSITANAVTVAHDAESYSVVATLTNTSETVAGADIKVELRKGISEVLATETVTSLAAGANTQVTLTVGKDLFETDEKTYYLYVNDKYLAPVTVTFEEAPVVETKSLEITAVDGTIKLAEESNTLRIIVQNTGNVDITDAVVVLKSGEATLGQGTVSAKAGQQGWANIAVDKTDLEAGTITVTAIVTLDAETTVENTAEITVEAVPVAQAAYSVSAENVTVAFGAESFEIKATVKNTSEVEAKNVVVKLTQNVQNVVDPVTIETLAAGAEETVTFTVAGPFTAGTTARYYVQVGDEFLSNKAQQEVTVTFEPEEEQVVDIALVDIRGLEEINLKNETNAVQVWFTNNSTVDELNATITLKMNDTEVATEAIAKGESYKSFTLPTEGLVAGEQAALVATLNVENNKEGNLAEVTKTLDIVSGEVAPAPAFTLSAENVEVLTTDAKVKVVVKVKNTGNEKAAQAEVKLLNGTTQMGESKYVFGLEADAEQNVTIEFDNFDKAGTYQMQAWITCGDVVAATYFDVIVKAPVAELAIESITGTIDLAQTSSNVTVTVKNNGTANVQDAKATLSYGETTLESTIAYIKAGETGYAYFQVPSEGITGETLDVTAKVEFEEQTVEQTATLTVKAAPAAEPEFSIVAENVEVPFGAESFEIKATVKNTSEVDAQGLTVKLLKGITEVETKTLNEILAAGAETTVTFTVAEIGEAGTTAKYYVQADGKAQAEVTVTFAKEAVAEVKDLAIETIQGSIDLSVEQNNVSVTVKNNGNVDAKNVKVTLAYGETTLEKEIATIKAGEQGYAYFQVASEGVTGETLAVTATVEQEGDATPDDNTKTQELTVKAVPAAEATFSLTAENVEMKAGEGATALVKVTNTSEVNATGVEVKLLYGTMTVATQSVDIAAGETKDVEFNVTAEQVSAILAALGGKTSAEIQAVAGKSSCFFTVTVVEEVETVVDMALTQIQGVTEINLKEENKVMVWYKNNGNVATTATIYASLNGSAIESKTVESVKAEGNGYVEFTLPTENLVAGETATFEATISAQGDSDDSNNTVSKTLTIVSGEEAPAPVIALNPVADQEVEAAGEQTINISVGVFNNGNADAENVEVKVYQEISTVLASKTVNIKQGESAIVSLSFDYDIQKATTFHVAAYLNNVLATETSDFTVSVKEEKADVAVAKIADITATTEDEVVIAATLQNKSDVAAENVLVALYQGTEQVEGTLQKVNEIEANGEAQVAFNLGKLAAGNYNYNVMITSTDDNMDNNVQSVSVKVTEYEAPVVNVSMTAIQGISNIDLAEGANNTISVWVANEGNVDAEATIAVTLNGAAVGEAQTITVKAEKNGNASFTLPTEGLVAGETATVVATVVVEGNTAEEAATTLTKEYNIVNSDVATEPVFAVTAENVTVAYDATSFDIVATVKNTSTVDAENVEVKLTKGIEQVGEAQTIATLAAGTETTLTFTVNEVAAGNYYVNVANNKAIAEVIVTVEDEPVEPVIAVALTQISLAGGQIDLAQEANIATVSVENTGNVDAQATIGLKINDTELEAQTITVKKEGNGLASFTLPTEGLVAGQKATLVATVTVADNTAEKTTETKEYDVVDSSVVTEPDFSVTAENVSVAYGAEFFEIKAVVKNTTDIVATDVEVRLLQGITEVATTTISELKGGAEQPVVFQVEATEENPFVAGKTATYYVQAAGKAQAEVTVTFAEEPVEAVVDMAVTSITGTLSLDVETNYLTIFVENKGTVDVTDARVALAAGHAALGEATVSVKAGATGFCSIAVPATAIAAGEFTVVATVTAEGEAEDKLEDNTLEKTYTIAAPAAELSFTVEATAGTLDSEISVKVTVKNSEKAAAENVVVTVYDANSQKLGEATIATLAAGAEETVTIKIANTYTTAGEYKNALQVTVAGVDGVEWATAHITEGTTAIAAIKAVYGENVEIFNLSGKKVNDVRRGNVYIINGKKVTVK